MTLVEKIRPHQITLVPDDPSQATSDHGWDFKTRAYKLQTIVSRLKQTGARISLFCDPDPDQVEPAVSTSPVKLRVLGLGKAIVFVDYAAVGAMRTVMPFFTSAAAAAANTAASIASRSIASRRRGRPPRARGDASSSARGVCARHDSDETVIGSARVLEIARREPRRASEKIDVQGYEKM